MAFVQSAPQTIVQIPDELISLFSRNLTFNPEQQAALVQEQTDYQRQQQLLQQQIQNQQPPPPSPAKPIIYSASQHYTHSSHVAQPPSQTSAQPERETQRRSSLPAVTDMVVAEIILKRHGVDPSVLTPSQLQLFRIAHEDQQKRLIELWAICPPTGAENIASLAWSSTSVEQEEQLARARYEQSQQIPLASAGNLQQLNDGRWLQNTADTEPYMMSGYEEMMADNRQTESEYTHQASPHSGAKYSRAMDPVYLGADYLRQQQQMEMATQYGAFEHFRGAGSTNDAMDEMK